MHRVARRLRNECARRCPAGSANRPTAAPSRSVLAEGAAEQLAPRARSRASRSTSATTSGSCSAAGSLSERELGAAQTSAPQHVLLRARRRCSSSTSRATSCALGRARPGLRMARERARHLRRRRRTTSGSPATATSDAQILKFTLDGRFLLQIGRSGQSQGSNDTANLGSPADLRVDVAARELYVADGYRNRRVDRVRFGDRRLQAPLGRVRRAAERRADAGVRPDRAAVAAVRQPGALRAARARRARCTSATASTTACRSSARTARSCPRRSSSGTRG